MGRAICPHCSFDLEKIEPGSDGAWTYDPCEGVAYQGSRLRMTPQCHEVLGTIMLAKGRQLSREVLAERLGYDGERARDLITVLLCGIKRACAREGAPFPVRTIWGIGVCWHPLDTAEAA